VDTTTGDVTSWKDPGHFVSEPVFVPRPPDTSTADWRQLLASCSAARRGSAGNAAVRRGSAGSARSGLFSSAVSAASPDLKASEEEDGLLLCTLLSAASLQLVHLVVLDAADLSEVARISFHANGSVTQTFHGVFLLDGEEAWTY